LDTPWIGIGNEDMEGRPSIHEGDPYFCPKCDGVCYARVSGPSEKYDWASGSWIKGPSGGLHYIKCDVCDKSFLVGVKGSYTGDVKPRYKGKI